MYACKEPVAVGRFTHKYQIEQSLVLIRRKYIPEFISRYNLIQGTDKQKRPELKFLELMKETDVVGYFNIPGGRNRPVPYYTNTFYVQHLHNKELKELKDRGLI